MGSAFWLAAVAASLVTAAAYIVLVHLSPVLQEADPDELLYRTTLDKDAAQLPKLTSSSATLELSVVVPAYNESKRIGSMLRDSVSFLEERQLDETRPLPRGVDRGSYEVLVVDDGSKDNTAEYVLSVAKELHGQRSLIRGEIKVVRLTRNRGKGGATRHGVLHASGHRILFCDADGASHFPDLALLQAELDVVEQAQLRDKRVDNLEQVHGVIVGSRAHLVRTEAVVKRSFLRNLLMRGFHSYLFLLGIRTIRDTQCGFKLFTRASAAVIYPQLHSSGWIFDCELLILAGLAGIPTREVGIQWHEVDGSKVDLVRDSINMAVDLLVIRINYLLGRWPRPASVGLETLHQGQQIREPFVRLEFVTRRDVIDLSADNQSVTPFGVQRRHQPDQAHEGDCQVKQLSVTSGMSVYDNPVPFSLFCELVTAIANVKPLTTAAIKRRSNASSITKHELVHKWVTAVKQRHEPGSGHDPLPVGTIVIFMRLFHPEQSVRRRVDELLDELASKSSFSARSDLYPILYPLPSLCGEVALNSYNTTAYEVIELHHTMREWHKLMPAFYRTISDLDRAAFAVEDALRYNQQLVALSPQVGVPVAVPKTRKPGACNLACKHLDGPTAVERKYDGERLQVHVDLSKRPDQQIQIFSKSNRDSTEFRIRMLPIIRAALRIRAESYDRELQPLLLQRIDTVNEETSIDCPTKIILEGEMVPFNEGLQQIDEFWKLPFAKTAEDRIVRSPGSTRSSVVTGNTESQEDMAQPDSRGQGEQDTDLHLMAVWFDVLLVDTESLLEVPYHQRRARLAKLIKEIHGFSQLAHVEMIDFRRKQKGLQLLREVFAHTIAMRGEGVMVKPALSVYNDLRPNMRWIKLKKDFIPGAGDTMDVHVLGASWQKQRGRELLVPPSTFTTFFVGFRADKLGADLGRTRKPHYHILFSSSYGLNRQQLSLLNLEIRCSARQLFSTDSQQCTTWRARPQVIFEEPRVFELFGAGFQKSMGSSYYELRWPRITKFDRSDGEPVDLGELQRVALRAMRLSSNDESSLVDSFWTTGIDVPDPRGGLDTDFATDRAHWLRKLEEADGLRPSFTPATEQRAALHEGESSAFQDRAAVAPSPSWYHSSLKPQTMLAVNGLRYHTPEPTLWRPSLTTLPLDKLSASSSPLGARQLSLPLVGSVAAKTSLVAPPLERKRRRLTLPTPSISQSWQSFSQGMLAPNESLAPLTASLSSETETLPLVLQGCFWSILKPDQAGIRQRTRHVHLRDDNHLVNALDVLWCAGWIPTDRQTAFPGKKRQGYIFVDKGDEDVIWLLNRRGKLAAEGGKELVWIVDRSALDSVGQWAVGKEMLSVF
ncbi:hypothetical protein OIV83_005695 [Microbotryomycetes sp. JL201]|nr:hypothetical protein OIV83_005695 [Microbotryomycetes sp. JL201]